MKDHILIRYGELALKKSNRKQFTTKIMRSIKRALSDYEDLRYVNEGLRFYIKLNGTKVDPLIPILERIPGIFSFSVVSKVDSNLDAINEAALEELKEEFKDGLKTFKVETHRALKTFPLTSLEISKEVSRYLFRNIEGLKCDVHHPETILNLDVRSEGTFLFTKIYPGLGGMPAGSIGKVCAMVSGGIDSVVAGYLAIRKGMQIEAVHFSSPPYTSDLAVQKVIDLLEKLTPYTEFQSINLHVVPFTAIQQAIYDNCRDDYGITIMRRMMYRITSKLCDKLGCLAILNGENIGQVASQTLESMATIGSVTNYPIIRPLATFDKSEIIDISLKIDTYDISIRPYEDCCTVFVPTHPQIRPRLDYAINEENKFDFEPLIDEAVEKTTRIVLKTNRHKDYISENDDIF